MVLYVRIRIRFLLIESGKAALKVFLGKIMKLKPMAEIEAALKSAGEKMGIEVAEVVFKKGRSPALTVFIDRQGGVDLDCCESFHRQIDILLDELDLTYGQPYTLNVSSLGLDRPFKTERDFERAIGQKVEIKLFAPLQGKKLLEGILKQSQNGFIAVQIDGEDIRIEKNKIVKISKLIEV